MTRDQNPTSHPYKSADPAADYRATTDTPGALRAETWLTVETRQAQRLINGRRQEGGKAAIIGLTRFAAMLRQIWAGARADDPYADWWLIKVHDALEQSQAELQTIGEAVEKQLTHVQAINIAVAHSLEPVRIPLHFSQPYAFRGAYLIAAFDDTVRAILTARHVGLMSATESGRLLQQAARIVRRAYSSPLGYKFLGINRDDLTLATARTKQARELMGEPPAAILSGEQRAPYAPEAKPFAAMNAHRLQHPSPDVEPKNGDDDGTGDNNADNTA